MDIVKYNEMAWDREVENQSRWTTGAAPEELRQARLGNCMIHLTPTKFVPKEWLGDVKGKKILCLASGGGQQGPILAAAGAEVTVFDNSSLQLGADKRIAEQEGLSLVLVKGNMKVLSVFENEKFDMIIHPISNCYVDNVQLVWNEAHRVLKNNGRLLTGFNNPISYIFDLNAYDHDKKYVVRYKIPYSDMEQLPKDELKEKIDSNTALEYGHSLQDLIGGQIKAGFVLTGYEEDDAGGDLLDPYIMSSIATMAVKHMQ